LKHTRRIDATAVVYRHQVSVLCPELGELDLDALISWGGDEP